MATLIGTSIAANYERAIMDSAFGTRKIATYVVSLTGVGTNFWNPSSTFAKALLGIQTIAEIFSVGYPTANEFVITVAFDTCPGAIDPWPAGFAWGDASSTTGAPSTASKQGVNAALTAAVDTATGGSSNVYNARFSGGTLEYNC